jgi:hypothetical protein
MMLFSVLAEPGPDYSSLKFSDPLPRLSYLLGMESRYSAKRSVISSTVSPPPPRRGAVCAAPTTVETVIRRFCERQISIRMKSESWIAPIATTGTRNLVTTLVLVQHHLYTSDTHGRTSKAGTRPSHVRQPALPNQVTMRLLWTHPLPGTCCCRRAVYCCTGVGDTHGLFCLRACG